MDSLFDNLLKKTAGGNRTEVEDFFTEVFAHLMRSNPEVLTGFLKAFDLSNIVLTDGARIMTQCQFGSSRPDITIQLSDGDRSDLLFIENKIGSPEGFHQLKKYAKVLSRRYNVTQATLVYITRDYDKKDEKDIFGDCPVDKPVFKQFRWHEVYRFLKEFEEDRLIVETLKFMEANNMAHNYLFSAVDILALTHFPEVIKLMDETMDGKAKEEFENVAGGISQSASRLTQLKEKDRYFYRHDVKHGSLWCGFGYWLYPGDSTRYPDVGLALEVHPNSPERETIIAAMKEVVDQFQDKWEGYDLKFPNKWSGIQQRKSLKDFLAKENHTRTIENYFIEIIDDLREFQDEHPELPWRKP